MAYVLVIAIFSFNSENHSSLLVTKSRIDLSPFYMKFDFDLADRVKNNILYFFIFLYICSTFFFCKRCIDTTSFVFGKQNRNKEINHWRNLTVLFISFRFLSAVYSRFVVSYSASSAQTQLSTLTMVWAGWPILLLWAAGILEGVTSVVIHSA